MTSTSSNPGDREAIRRLLAESGVEETSALSGALADLRAQVPASAPEPSPGLEALFTAGVTPLRKRSRGRGYLLGGAIIAAMAAGTTGVAATNGGFWVTAEDSHEAPAPVNYEQVPAPTTAPAGPDPVDVPHAGPAEDTPERLPAGEPAESAEQAEPEEPQEPQDDAPAQGADAPGNEHGHGRNSPPGGETGPGFHNGRGEDKTYGWQDWPGQAAEHNGRGQGGNAGRGDGPGQGRQDAGEDGHRGGPGQSGGRGHG